MHLSCSILLSNIKVNFLSKTIYSKCACSDTLISWTLSLLPRLNSMKWLYGLKSHRNYHSLTSRLRLAVYNLSMRFWHSGCLNVTSNDETTSKRLQNTLTPENFKPCHLENIMKLLCYRNNTNTGTSLSVDKISQHNLEQYITIRTAQFFKNSCAKKKTSFSKAII